jgi:hypothetical protein
MADEKPKQYGEPQRSLRISSKVWDAARERAYRERTSVNAVVAAFLEEYGANMPPLAGAAAEPEPAKPKRATRKPLEQPASDPRSLIRNLPSMG